MRMRVAALLIIAGLVVSGAAAQNLISARAGYVNYTQGKVFLPAGPDLKPSKQLEDGQSFYTSSGARAEVILTPGSYLRLDSNSEVRMLSTQLTGPVVEAVRGSIYLEVNDIPKTPTAPITIVWKGRNIPVAKTGIYRFEPQAGFVRVYVLQGKLRLPGDKKDLKSGRYQDLTETGVLSASAKMSKWETEFDRFNMRRAMALTQASELASYTIRAGYYGRSFLTSGPYASLWGLNGLGFWVFDPFSSFYTYVPYRYSVYNPWGYYYYAPRAYSPPRGEVVDGSGGGGGATTVAGRRTAPDAGTSVTAVPRTNTGSASAGLPRMVPRSALPRSMPTPDSGFNSRADMGARGASSGNSGFSGDSSSGRSVTPSSSPAPAAAPAAPPAAPPTTSGTAPRIGK